MDKLFLAGLTLRKKDADGVKAGSPTGVPASTPPLYSSSPSAVAPNPFSSSLYGSAATSAPPSPSPHTPHSPHPVPDPRATSLSPLRPDTACSFAHSGANGAMFTSMYGGRPPEQLLYDAATCDMVLVISDEVTVTRAIPVHKEILRSRNPGGYFARVLADPGAYPEYSEAPPRAGLGGAGANPLAGKPVLRRTSWSWPLASCLLGWLYRDCCEATWGQLAELRAAAEELGVRGLVDAIDYLLDPQHLLPWTAADVRAAAAACRKHQLAEAADRYSSALAAAGITESTRLASFVYHVRQMRPRFSRLPSVGPPPPDAAGAGNSPGRPGSLTPTAAAGRPGTPGGAHPPAAGVGSSNVPYAASGSSWSSTYRDARLGMDVGPDGSFRCVAQDSRTLRSLLIPARRKEYVLLAGPGLGSGPVGQQAPVAGGPVGRQRRRSSMAMGEERAGVGTGQGGSGRPGSPPAPYCLTAASLAGGGAGGGGYGGGGIGSGSGPSTPTGIGSRPRASLELPLLRAAGARGGLGSPGGAGSPGSGGGGGWGGGAADGLPSQADPDNWETLTLVVLVPHTQLAASLHSLVERQLGTHHHHQQQLTHSAPSGGGGAPSGPPPLGRRPPELSLAFGTAGGLGPGSPLGTPGGGLASPASPGSGSALTPSLSRLSVSAGFGSSQAPTATPLGPSSLLSLSLASSGPAPPPPHAAAAQLAAQLQSQQQGLCDVLTLVVGLEGEGQLAARLLAAVCLTLGAMDQSSWVVRTDAASTAAAVAFERKRASVDLAAAPLHGLSGLLGGSQHHHHHSQGMGGKGVIGPANPRDFYLPLADHPGGALAVSLPLGLLLVDPAQLEFPSATSTPPSAPSALQHSASAHSSSSPAHATPHGLFPQGSTISTAPGGTHNPGPGTPSASSLHHSSSDPSAFHTLQAAWAAVSGGGAGGAGGGGGGVAGGVFAARLAALVPQLLASGAALGQLCGVVGTITQVLRVAGEQHGVFAVPSLRACLRVTNPSAALLAVLSQTNTYFGVEPQRSAIYIRKPAADIVRLLQTLHTTLPVKGRGSHGSVAPLDPPAAHQPWSAGPDMGVSVVCRASGAPASSPASFTAGFGPGAGAGLGAVHPRALARGSLDLAAQHRLASASPAAVSAAAAVALNGGRRASVDMPAPWGRPGTPSLAGGMGGGPGGRRSLDKDRDEGGGGGGGGVLGTGRSSALFSPYGAAGSVAGSVVGVTMGVPYGQLERLFPGWHLHVVELVQGMPIEDF